MATPLDRYAANAPDYRVVVDGRPITPQIRGLLHSLRLTDNRGGEADQLDIVLVDADGTLAIPPKGAVIALALGWRHSGLVDRGTYTVDETEHSGAPDKLTIRARSADFRASLPGKRTESWHRQAIRDIIAIIAGRHKLDPAVSDALAGIVVDHIDQTEESDLNFLTRLAERYDAIATIKSGRLLFIAAGRAVTASGTAIAPAVFTRADGDSHTYSVTDRDSYTGVIANWRDVEGAAKRQAIAGSDDNAKTLRPIYASEADALAAARAEYKRIQRGEKTFALSLALGRAELYPETPAIVTGFKPEIDATAWLITEVVHDLGDSAYTNSISFEIASTPAET